MKRPFDSFSLLALAGFINVSSAAAEPVSLELLIRDHHFVPEELTVPAGVKVKLTITNEDSTPEEFESRSLKREKIIPGKRQVVLSIGPLDPGIHEFFGEFHEATAKGRLIVQ
ncbi:MAG: hypothetical protein RLZZ226_1734 [Pseudomonadota bacterium]|jgi:plastocyanin